MEDGKMNIESTVRLNNGVEMPWIGFGVFQVEPGQQTYDSVSIALRTGYRAVDTATIYENEKAVGRAISDSGIPREEIFVTTKVWNSDQGYDSTLKAFQASKKRLGLETVDLYLIHWPGRDRFRETWKALEKLHGDGEVRAIGVSNFLVHHLEELMEDAEITPVVDQVEFHPFLLQPELLSHCKKNGIVLEAWSPLTRGRFLDNEVIVDIARSHGKSPAQVLIRWDLQHEVITLPRSTREAHIRENADVFDFALTDDEMKRLDALDSGTRIGPNPDTFM
jgi:diketogulonate reductase-like aldo/keto reductase